MCTGPDPNNIVLILRTQSILFDRHSEELQPYKYAGYPMLIKVRHLCTPDSIEGNIFLYENLCLELTNPTKTMWFEWSTMDAIEVKEALGNADLFCLFCITFYNETDSKTDSESQQKLLFLGLNIC